VRPIGSLIAVQCSRLGVALSRNERTKAVSPRQSSWGQRGKQVSEGCFYLSKERKSNSRRALAVLRQNISPPPHPHPYVGHACPRRETSGQLGPRCSTMREHMVRRVHALREARQRDTSVRDINMRVLWRCSLPPLYGARVPCTHTRAARSRTAAQRERSCACACARPQLAYC
jgi:hypothetical protein